MNDRPYERRRLYRASRRDSVIFGVCGGLAEYFDLPPFGVRLAFIFLFPTGGVGLWTYIVLALLLKRRPLELPPPLGTSDPFYAQPRPSHAEMLGRVQERFEALDRRLQQMESIVTRPGFGLEEKYRDLK